MIYLRPGHISRGWKSFEEVDWLSYWPAFQSGKYPWVGLYMEGWKAFDTKTQEGFCEFIRAI